ncbi:MAG: hypothetical protein IB617_02320 [Candidatus Nealsonbacteria bacterium]|nr:MAG: hypothetical protein IB617_02320 [Candidatus Nealsonbacteria bacterium]
MKYMATEIEFRGPLTITGFQKLFKFLKKEARFVKKMKRKTFVFYFPNKNLDLKIRSTDGDSEIVVKKGFWGARRRQEIILPIETRFVKKAQKLLAALGYKKGGIAIRESYIFEYKSIEFALVKCPNNYYFYEAEFINNKLIRKPEEYIMKVLKSLNLKIWSEKEVYDFLMFCKKKIDKTFNIT